MLLGNGGYSMDLERNRAGTPAKSNAGTKTQSKTQSKGSRVDRGSSKSRKREHAAQTDDAAIDIHETSARSSEQTMQPISTSTDADIPLLWVEAEHLFVTRGYIYHMKAKGRPGRRRDSEAVIERTSSGVCAVLSSSSHAQLTAVPPRGWTEIEPADDVAEGARLGDVLVAVKHGGNEYTVVSTTPN